MKETVIDFSSLPKSEQEINLKFFKENAKTDKEVESSLVGAVDVEDPEPLKTPKNVKTLKETDNELDDVSLPDFDVDLEEEDLLDGEDIDEADKNAQTISTPKKKDIPADELDDTGEEVESDKKQKASRSQKRIQELANKAKKLLEEKLKAEEEKQRYEEELINLRKKAAQSEDEAVEQELLAAKQRYAEAFEANDPVKVAEEVARLQEITVKRLLAKAKKEQAEALKFEKNADTFTQKRQEIEKELETYSSDMFIEEEGTDSGQELGEEGQKWLKRNRFIVADQALFNASAILFDQIQEEGFDPNSKEAYEELEDRLSALRPGIERLFSKGGKKQPDEVKKKETPPPTGARPSVSTKTAEGRPTNGGKSYKIENGKVKAKPTRADVEKANMLGIPLQDYMKHKIKQEMAEAAGSKYIQVFSN